MGFANAQPILRAGLLDLKSWQSSPNTLYTEINARQLATALSFKRPITFISPDEAQDPKRLDDSWEVWKAEAMGGSGRRVG